MTTITAESTIVRTENLLATDLDEETILMSVEAGTYYGMEQTARRIWELVEKSRSVSELIEILSEEYHVKPEVCSQEIVLFLQELLQEGLVVVK